MFRLRPQSPCARFIVAALFLLIAQSGCERSDWAGREVSIDGWNTSSPDRPFVAKPIRICSFNIQSFGTKKIADADSMRIIVDVIRRFDIVAVQEVRSLDQTVVPRFLSAINSGGYQYDYVLSPRLGRGAYKEQYTFIYNTTTVELDRESVYTIVDEQDYFHREPMVATFRTRTPAGVEPFSFTLINMHTDPDDVPAELSVLDDVVRGVAQQLPEEDDVILIGDLNASPDRFGPLLELPNVSWALRRGLWTNTRRSNSYDNILFNSATTREFTGNAGVIDLRDAYGLDLAAALRVSDHMPIWAEFDSMENIQPIRTAGPLREAR